MIDDRIRGLIHSRRVSLPGLSDGLLRDSPTRGPIPKGSTKRVTTRDYHS